MAKAEAKRPDGIEAVAIVTPNHMHAGPAYRLSRSGHPRDLRQAADALARRSEEDEGGGREIGHGFSPLTHNYTGYPLVRRAREMVQGGDLGEIRLVQVEYPQDWLTGPTETTGNKQAEWRVDPEALGRRRRARRHRHPRLQSRRLSSTGLDSPNSRPTSPRSAQGRALDDNVQIMLRYANGARGALWASQVAPGNENGLRLRVYGTKGGLVWVQANPNELFWSPFGEVDARSSPAAGPDSGEAAGA